MNLFVPTEPLQDGLISPQDDVPEGDGTKIKRRIQKSKAALEESAAALEISVDQAPRSARQFHERSKERTEECVGTCPEKAQPINQQAPNSFRRSQRTPDLDRGTMLGLRSVGQVCRATVLSSAPNMPRFETANPRSCCTVTSVGIGFTNEHGPVGNCQRAIERDAATPDTHGEHIACFDS